MLCQSCGYETQTLYPCMKKCADYHTILNAGIAFTGLCEQYTSSAPCFVFTVSSSSSSTSSEDTSSSSSHEHEHTSSSSHEHEHTTASTVTITPCKLYLGHSNSYLN